MLDTELTVGDEVASVVRDAKQTHGMLGASSAPYRCQITLRSLYANQYVDRRAYIDMDLAITDATGKVVCSDHVKDDREQFRIIYVGGIRGMARMVNELLDSTVDKMLDKPALRTALAR